jgi:predicted exporter/2-polyprenyl-3-methyl-5-hydroxy-6-metoxy-1,4-benzoquinol methylase
MSERFVQLHLFLARHRGKVFFGFILFAVLAVLMGRKLKLNEDFTDILPMSAPAIAEQVEALKHIRQADRLYLDVATTTTNSEQLAAAAEQLTAALRAVPQLADLRGEINVADLGAAYAELQAQLPALLNASELRALEPRLAPAALEKRLAWLKQAMIQPQGMMFKNVAQTDPAGISDAVSVRLRALQAGVGDARIVGGRITSADGGHVLINATPEFRSSETGKSARLIAAVLTAARSVETNFPPGAVKISVTGAHRAALDNTEMIRADTTRTSILATLAIAVLIIVACRRHWLALLALVPVLFGALGSVTVFYLTGDLVSAVALGCGSMLIGVTVDYGIYIVYSLDDVPPASRMELARSVAGIIPALTFGALTTMAAFFVMLLSPISGHRQLGLFGALGVGLAALFAIVILPLFIPVKAVANARPLPLTALLRKIFAWRERHTRLVLPVLVLFTLVCVVGVSRVKFDGDLARLNGVTAGTQQDEKTIRETWGKALSLTTIVVGGATREEVLAKNEQVFAALEKLRGQNVFESFSSVAPLLPSAQTRLAHLRDWQEFWTVARQSELRDSLAAVGTKLGFRAGAFAPFLEKIAVPETAATVESDAALNRLTADFWSERDGKIYVTTLVKVADTAKFRQLHAAVKTAVPDALLLNKAALSDDITQIARRALPVFGVLVAVMNAFLLFLLLGRIELVLVTLLPMAAGILWTLGTLGLFGLPVDVANFVFVIFVVGVGGDYSLFLVLGELQPLRGRPERTAATGGAVTMCALTSLLGTGVLVLAHHPALFSVGLTALLGISFSLIATLFLVPLSVRWLARRNARRPQIANPTPAQTLRAVSRLYRFQGPYISQFAYWKMKTDPLFCAVEKAVPASGEILDVGCGYGLVAHWLTLFHPGRRVRGVDFDAEKIRVAQATAPANPQVSFERRDILEWPEFPACDAVLLCDVLHYFPHELKADVLRKIFAALRPGGCLIVRDAMAKADSGHRAVARSEQWAVRFGQNRTRHGLHFADEKTHLALLREAGFAKVEIRMESGLGSNRLLIASKL